MYEEYTCDFEDCEYHANQWDKMVSHYRLKHKLTPEEIREHEPI